MGWKEGVQEPEVLFIMLDISTGKLNKLRPEVN
jgi:hypothetical protein